MQRKPSVIRIEGCVFIGDVVNGVIHGKGIRLWIPSNTVYEGDWKNNLADGRGILCSANGDVYEGDFKAHKKDGIGILRFANGGGIYEGEFKDNKSNGRGILRLANGDVYEGDFKDDKLDGIGILRFANGDVYESEFKDGKPIDDIEGEHEDGKVNRKKKGDSTKMIICECLHL